MAAYLAAFLGVAAATECFGAWTHELSVTVAIALLLLYAVLEPLPARTAGWSRRALAGIGAFAFLAGIALDPPLRLAALAGFFAVRRYAAAGSQNGIGRVDRGFSTPMVVFASLQCLAYTNPALAELTARAASVFPKAAGAIGVAPLDLGPSPQAFDMFLLASALILTPKNGQRFSKGLVGWTFLVAFHLIALTVVAALQCGFADSSSAVMSIVDRVANFVFPNHIGILIAAFHSPVVVWNHVAVRNHREEVAGSVVPRRIASLCAAWAIALLISIPLTIGTRPAERPMVAFYEKGFLNWGTPNPQSFGMGSAGMLGLLPRYVESMGFRTTKIDELSWSKLAEIDVLVVVNQEEALPADEIAAVRRFIVEGGGLYLAADHTAAHGGAFVANQLLDNSHIRINFDNAEFVVGGWLHSLRFAQHPVAIGMDDVFNESAAVIGASLSTSYPATPLIVGRWAFSDPGDMTAKDRAYMGNRIHDPGERLGDLCLVACEEIGDGRVMVLGDTTPIANTCLPRTYDYVNRSLKWLSAADGKTRTPWRDVVGLVVGLAVLAILMRSGDHRFDIPWALTTLIVAFLGNAVVDGFGRKPLESIPDASLIVHPQEGPGATSRRSVDASPFGSRGLFVYDDSHGVRCSKEGVRNRSMSGPVIDALRIGYLPIFMRRHDPELLAAASVAMSPAPGRPFTEEEVADYLRFLTNGGTLILSIGHEERRSLEPLLDRIGITVDDVPLGRASAVVAGGRHKPVFMKAWPLSGGEAVATAYDRPIVVKKSVGRGTCIVLGDADYFMASNIETDDGAIEVNIMFLRYLMNTCRED